MSCKMCAMVMGALTDASASASAEESAPAEHATRVERSASGTSDPPVSARHRRTISATIGSRRPGGEMDAGPLNGRCYRQP